LLEIFLIKKTKLLFTKWSTLVCVHSFERLKPEDFIILLKYFAAQIEKNYPSAFYINILTCITTGREGGGQGQGHDNNNNMLLSSTPHSWLNF
jgi:hypothetical protein